jgi:hypothetical protein
MIGDLQNIDICKINLTGRKSSSFLHVLLYSFFLVRNFNFVTLGT